MSRFFAKISPLAETFKSGVVKFVAAAFDKGFHFAANLGIIHLKEAVCKHDCRNNIANTKIISQSKSK